MKRRNVQLAFVGEGNVEQDKDLDHLADGDEAVEIEVTGGTLMLVVRAATPDDRLFEAPSSLGGELVLENGVALSFQIQGDAVGAQFNARPADQQQERTTGLSSLPDIPGGV
jgi:hypothetical protein